MRNGITAEHFDDKDGNPAGGTTFGVGFAIGWQNGPLGRGADRKQPNGAFVEDVIDSCIDRLKYYQKSPFACESNAQAIQNLVSALAHLELRTRDREKRLVEGTHEE